MPGMTVLDRTRLGRWSMKQQGAEVLASLVESASTVSSSAASAVRAMPSRSRSPTTMPEHYTASSAAEIEEIALRTRVTGAGRAWLQDWKVPIGCMSDESVVPAQLDQVPTLSFIAEIPAQADSDGKTRRRTLDPMPARPGGPRSLMLPSGLVSGKTISPRTLNECD